MAIELGIEIICESKLLSWLIPKILKGKTMYLIFETLKRETLCFFTGDMWVGNSLHAVSIILCYYRQRKTAQQKSNRMFTTHTLIHRRIVC